jgi:hypothetical protein
MPDSMLDWMRRFQRKFSLPTPMFDAKMLPVSEAHPKNPANHPLLSGDIPKGKSTSVNNSPQRTLDGFLKQTTSPSAIFDESFGTEDLRLTIQRWREEKLSVTE